jgi:hypothetical protein
LESLLSSPNIILRLFCPLLGGSLSSLIIFRGLLESSNNKIKWRLVGVPSKQHFEALLSPLEEEKKLEKKRSVEKRSLMHSR